MNQDEYQLVCSQNKLIIKLIPYISDHYNKYQELPGIFSNGILRLADKYTEYHNNLNEIYRLKDLMQSSQFNNRIMHQTIEKLKNQDLINDLLLMFE